MREDLEGPLDADDWLALLARDPYAKGVELIPVSVEAREPQPLGPYVCSGHNRPQAHVPQPHASPHPPAKPKPKPKRVRYGEAALLARAELQPSIGSFALDIEIHELLDAARERDLVERFSWGRAKGYACTCPHIGWTPNMISEAIIIEWRSYWIRLSVTGSLSNLAFESHAIELLATLAAIDREALRPRLLYAFDCVFQALEVDPLLAFHAEHRSDPPDPSGRPPKIREASRLFPVAERPLVDPPAAEPTTPASKAKSSLRLDGL